MNKKITKNLFAKTENPKIDQKESDIVNKAHTKKNSGKISRILNDLPNDEKIPIEAKHDKEVKEASNVYNLEIPLNSGKKAFIIIPNDVSQNEIELIKNFIDAIKPTE